MSQEQGLLVALEGIDGCGKSTQARRLVARLSDLGYAAVTFREPGDSEAGRELRRIFVQGRDIGPEREMQLFLEDRRIDVRDNIAPALAAGKVVIMDRYYLSSVVYQGILGLGFERVLEANEAIAPRPDLTLILDIGVEEARRRICAARGSTNTFEGAEYLKRVRDAYIAFVDDERIFRVNAAGDSETVFERLLALVLRRLREG